LTLSRYLNGENFCVDDCSFKRGHFDLVQLCSWLREFIDEKLLLKMVCFVWIFSLIGQLVFMWSL